MGASGDSIEFPSFHNINIVLIFLPNELLLLKILMFWPELLKYF